jgi:hypothetical protein
LAFWGVLDLERPLGLGLLVRRRGLSERLFRRRPGASRIVAPEPGGATPPWDLNGDDPELVLGVLDEPVREGISALLRRWRDVVITDQSIRVILERPLARTEDLRELVHGMRTLAADLAAARRRLPPPADLRPDTEGWRALGRRLGLELEASFPGVAGALDGRSVRVTPVRAAEGYRAELRLGFRPHRRTGLRLRRQVEPDGYWSVGQDIQLGDPGFDAAFVVKGDDPEGVRELLSAPVREGLVALENVGRIDVDDRRLHVGALPADPNEIEPVVVQAARTAEAMGW